LHLTHRLLNKEERKMKKVRLIALLLSLVMVFALITGCAKTEAPADNKPGGEVVQTDGIKRGGTMVIAQGADPITLIPDGKPDDNKIMLEQNVFNRLLKTNNNQEVILDLATGYKVSDDGLTYTFTLPKNVKFHDGKPMTSDDVKFTFDEIIKQVAFASTTLTSLKEVTCPDDYTVVFTLSKVDAGFLGNLAYNGTSILPRHIYEGLDWMGKDSMVTPVGTGPFKYSEWVKGVKMVFVRNDDYYLGPDLPYLDKIVISFISDSNTAMQSFYNGELDVLGIIPPSTEYDKLLSTPTIKADKIIYPSRFYIAFNMAKAPYNDLNLRLAIAHATNADDMINKALKNIGMKSTEYMSPLYSWAVNMDENAKVPKYDLEKAKEYMAKTGLKADSNGVYMKVTVDTYNYEPFPDMVQVMKGQLAEIGIDVNINMLEYAAWDEKVSINKDYTIALTGGYQGPEASNLADRIITGGYLNFLNYSNPEVDRLMAEGGTLPTFEQRAPKYKEAQAILAKDVPMVLISEWLGYIPYMAYVKGHPASADAVEKTAFGEMTYVWMDK
jgi:peptide/nickel transport system substrate-binding protein